MAAFAAEDWHGNRSLHQTVASMAATSLFPAESELPGIRAGFGHLYADFSTLLRNTLLSRRQKEVASEEFDQAYGECLSLLSGKDLCARSSLSNGPFFEDVQRLADLCQRIYFGAFWKPDGSAIDEKNDKRIQIQRRMLALFARCGQTIDFDMPFQLSGPG
jgi:hypothetical protein